MRVYHLLIPMVDPIPLPPFPMALGLDECPPEGRQVLAKWLLGKIVKNGELTLYPGHFGHSW